MMSEFSRETSSDRYAYILEIGQRVCTTVAASLNRNCDKLSVPQLDAVLRHLSLISLLP